MLRRIQVAILDMNEELGKALVDSLGNESATFFECDVTNPASVESAVTQSVEWSRKTGSIIGGVVAAAGVANPGTQSDSSFHFSSTAKAITAKIIESNGTPLDLDGLKFVLDVNVTGTIDLIRQALVHMIKVEPTDDGERGVLVLVSSSAAFDGQPGQVSYSASKGAIRSLTLPLARDLARYGIRAVTIAPSLFDSGMTRLMSDKVRNSLTRVMEFPKRQGLPHEFASLVNEIIRNPMHNGSVIRLDGAMRMPSRM